MPYIHKQESEKAAAATQLEAENVLSNNYLKFSFSFSCFYYLSFYFCYC